MFIVQRLLYNGPTIILNDQLPSKLLGTEKALVSKVQNALVFYFTIIFPKILIGINGCRIGTHLRDESALSISHTEDKTTKPSYFSVKTVFDRTKWMCFKSLSCDLKYFFFDFLFLSLPPFFASLLSIPFVLMSSAFSASQFEADLQKKDYNLHGDCSFCFDC